MKPMRFGGLVFLAATIAILSLVWRGPPSKAIVSEDRHKTFLRIVNDIAMPAQFVRSVTPSQTGETTSDSKDCQLAIQRPDASFATEEAIKRIEVELRMSPLSQDIRRFNSPRSLADHELFRVDNNCNPLGYYSSAPRFHPPMRRHAAPFAVGYASEARREEVHLVWQRRDEKEKSRALGNHTIPGDFEVTNSPGPDLGRRVRIIVNGAPIAEWRRDRDDVSFLSNAQPADGYSLRIRDGRTSIRLARGESVAFPEGVSAVIVKVDNRLNSHGRGERVREVARFSWRKSMTGALFTQDERGRATWARRPNAFEVQVVNALKLAGSDVSEYVSLAWQPELVDALQGILDPHAEWMSRNRHRSKTGSSIPRRVFGSIAMLDTLSGEVLGFANWPHADEPAAINISDYVVRDRQQEFLRRDVIGSVAKVPLSLSVLSVLPALRDLRISSYDKGRTNTILGQSLGKPLNDHSSRSCGPTVNFHCFIAESLNRYAATLLALGAVSNPDDIYNNGGSKPLRSDWYAIGDSPKTITMQPRSFMYADGKANSTTDVLHLPWVARARDMFDIGTRTFTPGAENEVRQHLYMWRHALRPGTESKQERLAPFAQVSPEKEHLDLNVAWGLREDYIPLILGQGASTWSTVKVAETFARIVSNQKIQASFVKVPRDAKGRRPGYPALWGFTDPAFQESRSTLLAAMQDVVRTGTAETYFAPILSRLQRAAHAKELGVQVFAKTGTPRVASFISTAVSQEIDRMNHEGNLQIHREQKDGPMTIFYNGRRIERGDAPERHKPSVHRQALDLLADVNDMTSAQDQQMLCESIGSTLSCGIQDVRADEHDDGRYFAVVVNLTKNDEVICSVSVAISIVRTTSPDPLPKIVGDLFSEGGPIYHRLGLAKDAARQCMTP